MTATPRRPWYERHTGAQLWRSLKVKLPPDVAQIIERLRDRGPDKRPYSQASIVRHRRRMVQCAQ